MGGSTSSLGTAELGRDDGTGLDKEEEARVDLNIGSGVIGSAG